jgi:hypothetical protein
VWLLPCCAAECAGSLNHQRPSGSDATPRPCGTHASRASRASVLEDLFHFPLIASVQVEGMSGRVCEDRTTPTGLPHFLRCASSLWASRGITGTGAFDFAVLGSPICRVLHQGLQTPDSFRFRDPTFPDNGLVELSGFPCLRAKLDNLLVVLRSPLPRSTKVLRYVKLNHLCRENLFRMSFSGRGCNQLSNSATPALSIRNDSTRNRTTGACAKVPYKQHMISSTYFFSCELQLLQTR